ncbi:hypothetical protein BC832DRAFT_563494 [Gaertneriomyces semiglobifer]|nr:hypothetical protein BC832DRAFT_563494 [Gaertneriomyces semiglobifer]
MRRFSNASFLFCLTTVVLLASPSLLALPTNRLTANVTDSLAPTPSRDYCMQSGSHTEPPEEEAPVSCSTTMSTQTDVNEPEDICCYCCLHRWVPQECDIIRCAWCPPECIPGDPPRLI